MASSPAPAFDHNTASGLTAVLARREDDLVVGPFLAQIEDQAETADSTRRIDPSLIAAIKGSDVMRLSASRELGGLEYSMFAIGRELEAIAYRDPSLAWALWNHLCVFHLFVGSLGPENAGLLEEIVARREWVSFPAGAGSGVHGKIEGDHATLNGRGSFSTGAAYGDHCGVVFAVVGDDGVPVRPLDLRFAVVSNHSEGFRIDPSWDGSGLRASATDDVYYHDVSVPLSRTCQWFGANRAESLRSVPVVHHRYREDWVGISDIWLGWMALGVVSRALAEIVDATQSRRVIMGAKMVERPTVQINIGRATALTLAAKAAVADICHEIDERINNAVVPDTAAYYRQQAVTSMAVEQLSQAMELLSRTLGGNGTRESHPFDRRLRDFRSMPLHINVHQDRVTHQLGRLVLGVDLDPF